MFNKCLEMTSSLGKAPLDFMSLDEINESEGRIH